AELADLLGDRVDDGRMRVPERVHRDPADQVEVALAVGVPDVGALASSQRDRRGAVVVHQRRLPACLTIYIGRDHSLSLSGSTMVRMPRLVKISSSTESASRTAITCAPSTPPCTASSHPSILRNITLASFG